MKAMFQKKRALAIALCMTCFAYVAYAATFSLPAKVSVGTPLSVNEWNKMVDSIDYLKGEVDTLRADVAILKSKTLKTFVGTTTLTYDGA
ncbi:MAG: hypothetical protein QG650_945 [Patescibacteria group bacterium]|nr:hypothetical protein [Patescibacteria group bacterium]